MTTSALLYAPVDYWALTPAAKAEICNGCGASGGRRFPGHIWWLDITEACNIHDYMYHLGLTEQDREEADKAFLNNLLRIIEKDSVDFAIIKTLRRWRAMTYYGAVRDFGGPAFWDNKNKPGEMQNPSQVLVPAVA